MTQILERDFVGRVADAARRAGYRVTLEPSRIPNQRSWADGLVSLIRGPKFRPDILVEDDRSFVLVEVKSDPVLLGGVIRAKEYGDYFDASVVLCVPDESYDRIPGSVREFAVRANVRLCPLSEVGDALKELLAEPCDGDFADVLD